MNYEVQNNEHMIMMNSTRFSSFFIIFIFFPLQLSSEFIVHCNIKVFTVFHSYFFSIQNFKYSNTGKAV